MRKSKICTILAGLLFCSTSFGQKSELQQIDSILTNSYEATYHLADHEWLSYHDVSEFTEKVLNYLANPITFDNEFDSLTKYFTIKKSPDKKIVFYSWGDENRGVRHTATCVAQFKSDKGNIIVTQISFEDDYTDSFIYAVYEIISNKETFYLTFAWGSYGGGHEHRAVRLFQINGDTLQQRNVFADTKVLGIEHRRSYEKNLTFNQKKNQIEYNEFKFNEEMGFYEPTGEIITLEFNNGIFTKK